MDRVVVNRSFTLYKTFYADGVATDPTGTPTVVITRASTGAVVTTGAVTDEPGVGTWSVTVAATQNTLLDRLTVTWTATVNATPQQYVDIAEVAGDTICTIADLRALEPLSDTVKYPTARLSAMRTTVEEAIELEYGTAVVPRYTLEPRRMRDGRVVTRSPLRALRSLSYTTAGVTTAYTSQQLAALTLEDWAITGAWGWGCRTSQVTVGYEYGLDTPPGRLRQAAIRLARQWLVSGPVDDRALGAASPDGNFSFGLATPGRGGSVFGLPELDQIIQSSPYRVGVA